LGTAWAETSAEGVEFAFEAWWLRYREPLEPVPPASGINENLPDDVTEIPRAEARNRTNPYEGEFTRVSTFPGDEGDEAQAGFEFDLFGLSGGAFPAQITGGTVTFAAAPPESAPQAGDGAKGQRNEAAAAMVGCVAAEIFPPDFAGNWEDRPSIDEETCTPLELLEESAWVQDRPTWTLDLDPFAAAWAEENFGFIVRPDPDREGNGQVFHVAFKTTLNQIERLEDFPVPTADLTFEVEELDIPDLSFEDPGELESFDSGTQASGDAGDFSGGGFDDGGSSGGGGFDSGGSAGFDSGGSGGSGGFDSGSGDAPLAADDGAVEADDPEAADGEELDDEPVDVVDEATPLAADPEEEGGMNLAFLLVPLLGLGMAGTLGYSLSKDPELALEREGAVSKLMARKQAEGASAVARDL
jgi:hypothetical protein